MTFKQLFSIGAIAAFTLVVGCDGKAGNVDGTKDATFELEKSSLDFTAAGGDASVAYTITNPVQGGVVLTNCEASWIKNLSTATYGSITFTVAPNYTDKVREATIFVIYTGLEGAHPINISQEASTEAAFSYKLVYNAPREFTIAVTPADKETAYICDIYSEAYINSFNLGSDAALYAYHLKALTYEAERSGQSLMNYLRNVTYTGKVDEITFTELNPDTRYVVFSYHIDLTNAQSIGDIYREVITSAKPDQLDVELDMKLNVANTAIEQVITSSDENVYYRTGLWKVREFYSYYGANAKMEEVFPADWNQTVLTQQSFGKSVEQILEEFCYKGSQSINNPGLAEYTEYVFFLFAVDASTGFVASDPVIKTASTTSVIDSGVVITITVEDIFATTANVYWQADSKTATFRRGVLTKSEFDALGANDAERFETIKASDSYNFYEATFKTYMNLYNLTPSTTYVAFAYGVDGETPNTRIYAKEFTTLSNTPGKSNLQLSWSTHYNLAEVAAVDEAHWGDYASYSNSALVPVTISGVTEGDNVYIMLTTFPIDYYNGDGQWLRDVVNETYKVNCYSNYNLILEYEREYSIIAVAQDADGNYGQLFKRGEIYLYESDAADMSSYVYVENK